jgi:hypothetical protein
MSATVIHFQLHGHCVGLHSSREAVVTATGVLYLLSLNPNNM